MDVRAPTREDPLVAGAATALGGPPGSHARPARRRTALLGCLAVVTAAMALGAASRAECATGAWWEDQRQFANLCYSDVPHQYVDSGLAEQVAPLDDADGRWPDAGLSAPTAVSAYVVARVSQALFGVVDPVDRNDVPAAELADDPEVHAEAVRHTAVAAVLLALAALVATGALAVAQRGRPWDAMAFAAAPVLVLSGLIGWDLLPVALTCLAVRAWSRERALATGVLLGVAGAFALWPLVLLLAVLLVGWREGRAALILPVVAGTLGTWVAINLLAYVWRPEGWLSYWDRLLDTAPGLGSLWRVVTAVGPDVGAPVAWVAQLAGSLVVVALVGWLTRTAPRRPRVPQLALLLLAGFLLVAASVPVQAALWVLPFAVLARPRWRDLLIWQACEAFYFCATWWHLGGYTGGTGGDHDVVYPFALVVRAAGLLWLVAVVVRDVRRPWHDPVRADGVSDDPLAGPLADDPMRAQSSAVRTPRSIS